MEAEPSLSRALPPSKKRSLSRASTSSIYSITTQPPLDQFAQWTVTAAASNAVASAAAGHGLPRGLQPDDLMMQTSDQLLSAATPDFSVQSLEATRLSISYHHHPSVATGPPAFVVSDLDTQMLDRDDDMDPDADPSIATSNGLRASARNSAHNEMEMKNLFSANRHRNLQEVATELHGNERGPHSERARQIFAMLWINQVCSKGKGSVPRGRVYANYASRCATERITVLNPASFGKLVRVLFPGLKTRRLGVRGESKYHYVNFAMADDSAEPKRLAPRPAVPEPVQQPFPYIMPSNPEPASFDISFDALPADPTTIGPSVSYIRPTVQRSESWTSRRSTPHSAVPDTSHSFYNCPDLTRMDMMESTSAKTEIGLCFPPEQEEPLDSDPIVLPPIEPFLPPGTDPDAAKSLVALYRSHCTSLVECIRFCKEKTFFHLYTSFQGTLTVPVQRLFGKPSIAAWIEQCDCILYQRMMRIISRLTLQVLPDPVLSILRSIHELLADHIREAFEGQPQHVIHAKVAPATLFTGLVHRTLRVNLAAHAAANMLANDANRDQMYYDWINLIRPRKIAEHVPTRGMDDVVNLLIYEIRRLLDPRYIPWELEFVTVYADVPHPTADEALNNSSQGNDDPTGKNVLDRWVSLLRSLPRRFPYASHAEIVWCVERIGTAVMRDITIRQGKSFGAWWVTKTWIDEMVWLLAERGAFMRLTSTTAATATTTSSNRVAAIVAADSLPATADPFPATAEAPVDPYPPTNTHATSWSRSHLGRDAEVMPGESGRSSGGGTMPIIRGVGLVKAQPDRAPFPSVETVAIHHHNNNNNNNNHDDSGIGSEEEFRVDKFGADPLAAFQLVVT